VPSREATNANFTVFGLTRKGLEPTINPTRGKHANYYTFDAVAFSGIELGQMRVVPDVVFVFWIFNLQDENGCCCCG
jgi:hypothetical protein